MTTSTLTYSELLEEYITLQTSASVVFYLIKDESYTMRGLSKILRVHGHLVARELSVVALMPAAFDREN